MKKVIVWLLVGSNVFLMGSQNNDQVFLENLIFLSAPFLLGLIGIIILFISSRQLMKTRQLHEDMVRRQLQMEQGQTSLLTNMSENIFRITKEAIENRNSILENSKERSLEHVLAKVIHTENTLLDRTNDLIGFLRLKSKKVQIINESFNLNNVLNEVSGTVCANFQESQAELIFDIDNTVPRYLIGDSLHLGQILINLLDFGLSQTSQGEVKLKVSIFYTFEEKTQLQFQIIDTGVGLNSQSLEKLFVPYYDEEAKEYIGLGRFVAHQLVSLMGGEITIQSVLDKGTTLTFVLPLQIVDVKNRRNYHLPEKILTAKKVFIVDGNYNAALAIKKMFAYFKHDVKVISKEQFLTTRPNLEAYDIIVLDEELFNFRVVEYIKKIKENKEIRIIGISSLLRPIENKMAEGVTEGQLQKPLNQERVFDLIVDLYRLDKDQLLSQESEQDDKPDQHSKAVQPHTAMHIQETRNIKREQFADFKGANLLIVEDNLINQKVLTTILDKSGMNITLANNGEEALMMVTSGKILFDLVLMDINMPVMDGYTATEYIRATGKFDDLPIVSFTALVLDSEVQKMFNSGINGFLAKPLNIGKLYTAFDMFIGSTSQTNSSEAFSRGIELKVDGIDIQEGIKHANGNEALYIELLREFLAAYGESGELLHKLVKENRFEQIKILCLDMKGLAGTIGARDMYQEVDKIYKLFIYNNQSLLPKYTEGYQSELKRLTQAIHRYLEDE